MAQFRQYNIQALPLNVKKTSDIGKEGYRKLLQLLGNYTAETYKDKAVLGNAYGLVNDTYIFPFVVHAEEKYAYGKLVKFHKAETVTELYSSEPLFKAEENSTAVTNKFEFRFVFDYDYHILAIEELNNRLPSPIATLKALETFFQKIAHFFPDHVIKINLIADQRTLKEVLHQGNEYGPVHVKLTFPNGHKFNKTMRQMRDKNTHTADVKVAPERGQRMFGLPDFVIDLLKNAPKYGQAVVVFFQQKRDDALLRTRRVYSTLANPERFTLRQKKNETENEFIERLSRTVKFKAGNR